MKLQFSLATLLIIVTVLAVVTAACVGVPVYDKEWIKALGVPELPEIEETVTYAQTPSRPIEIGIGPRHPKSSEMALRMAKWWPISIAGTLAALWAVRRFRTR